MSTSKKKPKQQRQQQKKKAPRKPKEKAKEPKPTKAPAQKRASKPVKTRKVQEPRKEEEPPTEKKTARPAPPSYGPAPAAGVSSRHGGEMHEREGRGFSFGELESAGVTMGTARREELRLDVRRRSVVVDNVEKLKAWLETASPQAKAA